MIVRNWCSRVVYCAYHGPPLVSGKVVLTSNHAVVAGGSQDIFTGELTGQEVRLVVIPFTITKLCPGRPRLPTKSNSCRTGGEASPLTNHRFLILDSALPNTSRNMEDPPAP